MAVINITDNFTSLELQDQKLTILIDNLDKFFLVVMGILIIFMQAGFGFLEAGSVRAKNTTNILIKNYADLAAGTYKYIIQLGTLINLLESFINFLYL